MSADHPLIGLDVRVIPGSSSGEWRNSFDGVVADVLPNGLLLVMRTDNGSMRPWISEYVHFADPERAARALRLHATDNDFRAAGCTVLPEYTPPRWVPTHEIVVGTRILAGAQPDGSIVVFGFPGCVWTEEDHALAPTMPRMWALIGEWPSLPKENT